MDPKPRPNHAMYIACLRRMTAEQRAAKAFELTEFTRDLFKAGLRQRFPDWDEAARHRFFVRHLHRCSGKS